MRKTCLALVHELARNDERIFFVGSDLGVGTLAEFGEEMPGRFFMEGVSEANAVGMAAGLAMAGKIPYVNTIATFLTRRCFEQNVIDLGLHDLPVRLIGNGGGFVYAPLGPTHQAIDDLAIMRTIPNMTIVAPADADEMRRLMPLTVDWPHPIYIRLGKGYDPIVSREDVPFAIGKGLLMRQGDAALVVTTGITLKHALAAATELAESGIEVAILHLPTIKPLDTEALLAQAAGKRVVVTIEEHLLAGGLGSAVAEVLAESASVRAPLVRIGIPDAFADAYGSQASLMAHFGITDEAIVEAVTRYCEGE